MVLGKPYPGTGVVTILNRKEGWVEIEHQEIKDLMPAMQMEFWVRDSSLMDAVRVGDKVDFVVVEDSKGQYLTELKRVFRQVLNVREAAVRLLHNSSPLTSNRPCTSNIICIIRRSHRVRFSAFRSVSPVH